MIRHLVPSRVLRLNIQFAPVVILAVCAPDSVAQLRNWTAPAGGSYWSTGNWSPADVPNTVGESAGFNLDASYNVSFFAGDNITINDVFVNDGDVTFVAPGVATYNIDSLLLTGGDLTLYESAGAGRIDLNATNILVSEGSTLGYAGGSKSTAGAIDVGAFVGNSPGRLSVNGGSTLDVLGFGGIELGLQALGVSEMYVDGAGSMLSTAPGVQFAVGVNGGATLDVTNGATVFADRGVVYVGNGAFNCRLTIDSGSTFTTHDTISGDYGNTQIGASTFTPATVEVLDGSIFEPGEFEVRGGSDVIVDGGASRLSVNYQFGLFDSSSLTVQNGATLELLGGGGGAMTGTSELILTGAGTTLFGNDGISFDGSSASNPASLQVLDGAVITPTPAFNGALIEFYAASQSNSYAEIIVDGAGSLFESPDSTLQIGTGGTATVDIRNGGTVSQWRLHAGTGSTGNATINLDNGTLELLDDATIGGNTGGTAVVNLLPGSLFDVGGDFIVNAGGEVNLFGGEVRLSNLTAVQNNGGAFNWNNGTVRVNGNATLAPTVAQSLVPDGDLSFGQEMRIVGDLTLQSTLVLDGGTLAVEGLTNRQLLQLQSGVFEWLDSELVIADELGSTVDLGPNMTIKVQDDLTATGLITGDGTLSGHLGNYGIIRVESGKSIGVVDGASHSNGGEIQLLDGRISFSGNASNSASGRIVGRGALTVDGTLTNSGEVLFSAGVTDVFGDVANTASGVLMSTGGATVTYYDDVAHNGAEIRTSADSKTVFLGDVTGAGAYTGPGTVYYEGTFSPGNSPAAVSIETDASFGPSSMLAIELAGYAPGAEFDQLLVGGAASLDGTLLVSAIDRFLPRIGDSFEIMTYGTRAGEFADVRYGGYLDGFVEYGPSSLSVTITAVPEPSSLAVGLLTTVAFSVCLRNSQSRKPGETQS